MVMCMARQGVTGMDRPLQPSRAGGHTGLYGLHRRRLRFGGALPHRLAGQLRMHACAVRRTWPQDPSNGRVSTRRIAAPHSGHASSDGCDVGGPLLPCHDRCPRLCELKHTCTAHGPRRMVHACAAPHSLALYMRMEHAMRHTLPLLTWEGARGSCGSCWSARAPHGSGWQR